MKYQEKQRIRDFLYCYHQIKLYYHYYYNQIVVKYEALKEEIRRDTDSIRKKGRFLLPFNPDGKLSDKMEESLEKISEIFTWR